MTDDSNAAEQLDPSVLGEHVGDEERPGDDFPPDEPLGVDDPAIVDQGMIARDDVASREERRVGPGNGEDGDTAPGLVDPGDGGVDAEPQLLADRSETPEQAPEARAVNRIDDADADPEPGSTG